MKAFLSIVFLLFVQLATAQSTNTYFPEEEWRKSTPSAQGLDEGALQDFVDDLRNAKLLEPISTFLVIKNGYLVVDEVFGGYNPNRAHTMQSVTKSITSTLIGVAIQEGHIESVDQKILSFFPEYSTIRNLDENKRAMDLSHALTMRTGQAWTGESHLDRLNSYSGDKMKYVLDYKMEQAPGQQWYYNSGIAILLGGLLENATGMNTELFARKSLFEPLGIEGAYWRWGHRGIPHTGGGLFLRPQDLARIGYLYLQDGRWKNNRILPEGWVSKATSRQVSFAEMVGGVASAGYGYMWWVLPYERNDKSNRNSDIIMAYGHWGQYIFIVPKHKMIVVITNDNSASYPEEIKPISLFYERILPAVDR